MKQCNHEAAAECAITVPGLTAAVWVAGTRAAWGEGAHKLGFTGGREEAPAVDGPPQRPHLAELLHTSKLTWHFADVACRSDTDRLSPLAGRVAMTLPSVAHRNTEEMQGEGRGRVAKTYMIKEAHLHEEELPVLHSLRIFLLDHRHPRHG